MENIDAHILKQIKNKALDPLIKSEQTVPLFISTLSYNMNNMYYRDLIPFERDTMVKQIKSSLNIESIEERERVTRFFSHAFIILFDVLLISRKSV